MSSSARVASDDRTPLFRGRTIGPLVAPASVARSPPPFRGGSAFRKRLRLAGEARGRRARRWGWDGGGLGQTPCSPPNFKNGLG
jgi:hypothetical protein